MSKGWSHPKEVIITVPIGSWAQPGSSRSELGAQMLANLVDGLNSFGVPLLESAGEERESSQRLVTAAIDQYKNSGCKMSMNMYLPPCLASCRLILLECIARWENYLNKIWRRYQPICSHRITLFWVQRSNSVVVRRNSWKSIWKLTRSITWECYYNCFAEVNQTKRLYPIILHLSQVQKDLKQLHIWLRWGEFCDTWTLLGLRLVLLCSLSPETSRFGGKWHTKWLAMAKSAKLEIRLTCGMS